MAPSFLAAALLQGTLLCSYFWSSGRQGFQITSKAVLSESSGNDVLAVGCHSLFPEVEEQSCVTAHWSSFSRKSCSAVPTPSHSPVSWPGHWNFFGPVQTKPVGLLLLFSVHGRAAKHYHFLLSAGV